MCYSAVKSVERWMARFLHHPSHQPQFTQGEYVEMKQIFSVTVAAFVLGAAIAARRLHPPHKPRHQHRRSRQLDRHSRPNREPRHRERQLQRHPERLSNQRLDAVAGSQRCGTAGATATAGGADAVTYSLVAADGSKVDLASMADKCVEIGGVLAPAAGGDAKPANRTFTVATIKSAEDCK